MQGIKIYDQKDKVEFAMCFARERNSVSKFVGKKNSVPEKNFFVEKK